MRKKVVVAFFYIICNILGQGLKVDVKNRIDGHRLLGRKPIMARPKYVLNAQTPLILSMFRAVR
jgi:hypothetical protein